MNLTIQLPSISELDDLLRDDDAQVAFRRGCSDAENACDNKREEISLLPGSIYHGPTLECNAYLIGYISGQWERLSDKTKNILLYGNHNSFRIGLGLPINEDEIV
jgi:hypothetical protein